MIWRLVHITANVLYCKYVLVETVNKEHTYTYRSWNVQKVIVRLQFNRVQLVLTSWLLGNRLECTRGRCKTTVQQTIVPAASIAQSQTCTATTRSSSSSMATTVYAIATMLILHYCLHYCYLTFNHNHNPSPSPNPTVIQSQLHTPRRSPSPSLTPSRLFTPLLC